MIEILFIWLVKPFPELVRPTSQLQHKPWFQNSAVRLENSVLQLPLPKTYTNKLKMFKKLKIVLWLSTAKSFINEIQSCIFTVILSQVWHVHLCAHKCMHATAVMISCEERSNISQVINAYRVANVKLFTGHSWFNALGTIYYGILIEKKGHSYLNDSTFHQPDERNLSKR